MTVWRVSQPLHSLRLSLPQPDGNHGQRGSFKSNVGTTLVLQDVSEEGPEFLGVSLGR